MSSSSETTNPLPTTSFVPLSESEYVYSTPSNKRIRPYEVRTPQPKRIATERDFAHFHCIRHIDFEEVYNNNMIDNINNNLNNINNLDNINNNYYINNLDNINNNYNINNLDNIDNNYNINLDNINNNENINTNNN